MFDEHMFDHPTPAEKHLSGLPSAAQNRWGRVCDIFGLGLFWLDLQGWCVFVSFGVGVFVVAAICMG